MLDVGTSESFIIVLYSLCTSNMYCTAQYITGTFIIIYNKIWYGTSNTPHNVHVLQGTTHVQYNVVPVQYSTCTVRVQYYKVPHCTVQCMYSTI